MTEMTSVATDLLECHCDPCLEETEHLGHS